MRVAGPVRLVGYALAVLTVYFVVTLSDTGSAQAETPNPPWQQQCPLRIALVVDLSESMAPSLDAVRQSAGDMIDALRGAPNQLAVITLGTDAVVAVPPTDVGADEPRRQVKSDIDDLQLLEGDLGATNWDAAFTAARGLHPDVVILLTDGQPTAYGTPAIGGSSATDSEPLAAAVRSADALKGNGTRIVGLGLGLTPGNVGNLAAVTGPAEGDDFYRTDASGLLSRLYEITGKACGVPVALLPQPEPGTFPLTEVISAAVAAVLAAVGIGIVLSRRRNGGSGGIAATPSPAPRPLPDPTISLDDLPRTSSIGSEPRRISLARFLDEEPDRHDRDGGAGGAGTGEPRQQS